MDILQSVNLDHECHFCFHFSAFDEVRKLVADGLDGSYVGELDQLL